MIVDEAGKEEQRSSGRARWFAFALGGLALIITLTITLIILLTSLRTSAPLNTTIGDSSNSNRLIDVALRDRYNTSLDELTDGNGLGLPPSTRAIDIINIGLDCAIKPIDGDQCPEGYVAARRTCREGYCCMLKDSPELNNAMTVIAVNFGINLIASEIFEQVVTKPILKKVTAKGFGKLVNEGAEKAIAKVSASLTARMTAKVVATTAALPAKVAKSAAKASNPIGAAIMLLELINMSIDLYDPRGYMQYTSSEAFSAVRDAAEYQFISALKEVLPGPPFIYPVHGVLTDKVKTADGEMTLVEFATSAESSTSIAWLKAKRPDVFERVIVAAIEAEINVTSDTNTCQSNSDACTSYTTAESCVADPSGVCTFASGRCVNSNFVQGLLDAVPLAVRDAHFIAAVKSKSPASAELITIFDRRVHTWFKGPLEFPYAVSLSAKGQDRVNKARVEKVEPTAFITRSYRDVGTGTWTLREKNVDVDGVSDASKTNTLLNTITTVPRMIEKTMPAPLCLMTMNDFLRSLCEDEKSGGIEQAAKINHDLGMEDPSPLAPTQRDNLNPGLHGVRLDPNTATCKFTKAYCAHAGLAPVTNRFGHLDCEMPPGQGSAELIFGTTLVRSLVASAENAKLTLAGMLNPANYYKKKPGETCHSLSECDGVQHRVAGKYVSCCPATAEIGQKVLELTGAGAMAMGATWLTMGASTIAAMALFDKAAQLPRTCQVMDWTRTGALQTPYCPFDPLSPMKGPPIKDGELCGVATTCERCAAKTQSFWKSKGFTACGIEPRWENGTRCGPGVTCSMCKNGSSAWDDGAHRCGPRVAGTTVALGGACAYSTHCLSYNDTNAGKRTMCCDGKCTLAVADNGAWYCPGGILGKTKEGGACKIGGTCEGFTSATERIGCCDGVCTKQKKVDGLWKCPSELVKDKPDGTVCAATECLRCKNPSSFWYVTNRIACGREPSWRDGTTCAAGTSCNSCVNKKSSVWSDGKVRCGVQGKTWPDGKLCAKGTTCERYCINPATAWRNGSWYCGKQPAERCCSDHITFGDKCLLKTGVIKLPTGCTAGMFDPGDGRCHGVAVNRC